MKARILSLSTMGTYFAFLIINFQTTLYWTAVVVGFIITIAALATFVIAVFKFLTWIYSFLTGEDIDL